MGTVVEVGPKVTKSFKKGDRVAGFTHGVNAVEKEDGCFAQYAVAKGDVQCKLPDNLSDEDAATLGVGVTTVGQGLYQSLGLPLPGSGEKTDEPLLIYGGSTATGSLAIQFAVLSGCKVVTTCSPRNFPFVKALGAAEAFDYNDPECAQKIREYTGQAGRVWAEYGATHPAQRKFVIIGAVALIFFLFMGTMGSSYAPESVDRVKGIIGSAGAGNV